MTPGPPRLLRLAQIIRSPRRVPLLTSFLTARTSTFWRSTAGRSGSFRTPTRAVREPRFWSCPRGCREWVNRPRIWSRFQICSKKVPQNRRSAIGVISAHGRATVTPTPSGPPRPLPGATRAPRWHSATCRRFEPPEPAWRRFRCRSTPSSSRLPTGAGCSSATSSRRRTRSTRRRWCWWCSCRCRGCACG